MRWFPAEQFQLESRHDPATVAQRLQALVERRQFRGEITDAGFSLQWRAGLLTTLSPVFYGAVTTHGDGSQIAVEVAPSPVSLLVVVGWGVLLAYQVIQPAAPWLWLHVGLFVLVGWIWLWSCFWLQGASPRQTLEQALRE